LDTSFVEIADSGYRGARMSLIHCAKPFWELGICKEYSMSRKTTGNGVSNRSKKTGASAQPAANLVPGNLEEEIRRRAYELFLQRQATGSGENGDENLDWLTAEREIRSRYGRLTRHTTA
jgi:hypothetical protein